MIKQVKLNKEGTGAEVPKAKVINGLVFDAEFMYREDDSTVAYKYCPRWNQSECGNCGTKLSYANLKVRNVPNTYVCPDCGTSLYSPSFRHYVIWVKQRSKLGQWWVRFKLQLLKGWFKLTK